MTFCFSTFLYIHYLAGISLETFPFFMIALRWRTPAAEFSFLYDPGLGYRRSTDNSVSFLLIQIYLYQYLSSMNVTLKLFH